MRKKSIQKIVVFSAFLFASALCYSQSEKISSDSCFAVKEKDTTWRTQCVQIQPEFIGGIDSLIAFLKRNIKYPKIAKETGVQGKVFVSFIIDKKGNVEDVYIYKSNIPAQDYRGKAIKEKHMNDYKKAVQEMEEQAVSVVTMMPRWKPGSEDGKLVRVRYILPVVYKLA